MKVEIYGQPYSQPCQDAVGLLKSAKIEVEFHDITDEEEKLALIGETKELQKNAGYNFKTVPNNSVPIVISHDTKEVLVGYDTEDHLYGNILKEAEVKEMDNFITKYPEWSRKKPETK